MEAAPASAPRVTGAGASSPSHPADDLSTRAQVAAVEARLAALENLEPVARTLAFAAVQGLAELYGEGLTRIVVGLEGWARHYAGERGEGEWGVAECSNGVAVRGGGVEGHGIGMAGHGNTVVPLGNASEVRGSGAPGSAAGEKAEASDPLESLLEDELIAHLLILHDLHPHDLTARVEQALDEVRPYLRSHGGDAEVVNIEDGVVQIRMIGSCQGCPSSMVTLSQAVEEAVRRLAPEVERVVEAPRPVLVQLEGQRA